jgi:hypothetical protein
LTGSIQRRIALLDQQGIDSGAITKQEAMTLATGLMNTMETGDAINFMNNIKIAAGPRGGKTLALMAKQVTPVNPTAGHALNLMAAGDPVTTRAYMNAVRTKRFDASPTLASDYNRRRDQARKTLEGVNLPNSTKELMTDVAARLTAGTEANVNDVFEKKFGKVVNAGNWFANKPVFVPADVNQDAVMNFIRNPYTLVSKVYKVSGKDMTGTTIQNTSRGLAVTRDGILQTDKAGRPMTFDWSSFGGQ